MICPQYKFYQRLIVITIIFLSFSIQAGTNSMSSIEASFKYLLSEYGDCFTDSADFAKRLKELRTELSKGGETDIEISALRKDLLMSHPKIKGREILYLRRRATRLEELLKHSSNPNLIFGWGGKVAQAFKDLGIPSNHECHSTLKRDGYDNQVCILKPSGQSEVLFNPKNTGYVGDIDLHWNGDRFLMTRSDSVHWTLWEMSVNGSDLRQVSRTSNDIHSFDGCYLPDGRIVFGSTAPMQSVPCWHGQRLVSNLYRMDADGSNMERLCYDQDHDFHPSVLPSGMIVYQRWDYTGINHIFLRQLMVMNPDGTGQKAVYGSNSWFPNALYSPQAIPRNQGGQLLCILSGYHGAYKMGQLVRVDTDKGQFDTQGLIQRISGKSQFIEKKIKDNLVDDDWPKFMNPFPIDDHYFLVSCWPDAASSWGIYLGDSFGNLVPVIEEPGYALFEAVPVLKRQLPRVIPDRIDKNAKTGLVYLHDVYQGPGLEGVPRGEIEALRVIAYHFGYPGMAGPYKVGFSGPWEVMRILGTVPLEDDGSVLFEVPANTPIAFQALDNDGCAVQLMRSWTTVRPGEVQSCTGCHERPGQSSTFAQAIAATSQPRKIKEWYGSARGFDFEREVQPVLNHYCVSCHDGSVNRPDLRSIKYRPDYEGRTISSLGRQRLHPAMQKATQGKVNYTPAYDSLLPYLRRVGIEDDVSMLIPGEYHARSSELFQMLIAGHHGVQLSEEAWDRLVTWLDLNAPCHGTWGECFPIQDKMHHKRMKFQTAFGGPELDYEDIPEFMEYSGTSALKGDLISAPCKLNQSLPEITRNTFERRTIEIEEGFFIELVKIPAQNPYWIAVHEITNEQYRYFDEDHDSRYYQKRHARSDDMGLTLNEANQPVVRVSWKQARKFCDWLSDKSGLNFSLPDKTQWKTACDAGDETLFYFDSDVKHYSRFANMADSSFTKGWHSSGVQVTGGVEHLDLEGAALADTRFNDGSIVSAEVASYQPNRFGLFDMHGNVAEWVDTQDELKPACGGSFFDRPERCSVNSQKVYADWQRVFNVGFRVVVN